MAEEAQTSELVAQEGEAMNDNSAFRVWFVTGASSGFGRAIAEAALERGDSVVAAARRLQALGEVAEHDRVDPVALRGTDAVQRDAASAEARGRVGRIDVLVNKAGRTQVGAVEETTDEELRARRPDAELRAQQQRGCSPAIRPRPQPRSSPRSTPTTRRFDSCSAPTRSGMSSGASSC